jgi:hypothetical protein
MAQSSAGHTCGREAVERHDPRSSVGDPGNESTHVEVTAGEVRIGGGGAVLDEVGQADSVRREGVVVRWPKTAICNQTGFA